MKSMFLLLAMLAVTGLSAQTVTSSEVPRSVTFFSEKDTGLWEFYQSMRQAIFMSNFDFQEEDNDEMLYNVGLDTVPNYFGPVPGMLSTYWKNKQSNEFQIVFLVEKTSESFSAYFGWDKDKGYFLILEKFSISFIFNGEFDIKGNSLLQYNEEPAFWDADDPTPQLLFVSTKKIWGLE